MRHVTWRFNSQMQPLPTGKILENLYAVRDRDVNLFVYKTLNTVICFDAGYGGRRLYREFSRIGVDPCSVTHLFLTHSDVDHAGGMSEFRNATKYLPQREVCMTNGSTPRFMNIYFNSNKHFAGCRLLRDKETVDIDSVTVGLIETPGHTPGSACYVIGGRILITGDTLFIRAGKVQNMIEFYNMDTETQRSSISGLAGLEDITLICSAHSGHADFTSAMEGWSE
jgi:glyoxylase-like metal-dependent hydrolase (beta-lactamase superfamily II)